MRRFPLGRLSLGLTLALLGGSASLLAQGARASERTVGPESAPVVLEVFSDFQCPYCKNLEEQTLNRVRDEYARTGKIRLVHHDFPLSGHAYARDAARLALAADRVGKFPEVVEVLFREQEKWAASGEVEATVASVLTPGEAKQVRSLAADPSVEAAVNRDVQLGYSLQVESTPTMIIRHQGQAYRVAGAVSYEILTRFLDQLLAQP